MLSIKSAFFLDYLLKFSPFCIALLLFCSVVDDYQRDSLKNLPVFAQRAAWRIQRNVSKIQLTVISGTIALAWHAASKRARKFDF